MTPDPMKAAPSPQLTTPDYTAKQTSILSAGVAAAQNTLAAVARLAECTGMLAQSGGNFTDAVFDPAGAGGFAYLDSYHADVLLQQASPALNAFLDTPVNNDSGLPSYRQLFQMCARGPI